MLRLSIRAAVLLLCSVVLLQAGQGEPVLPSTPLKDVSRVQILPTVVGDPKAVKNPDAAEMVEQSLRRSVLANDIQVTESAPIKVRLLLDEFSGGNFAKRFAIGLGAGRSSVSCRIQLLGPGDNEIANVRVKVRGDLSWGGYEGNATQTKAGREQIRASPDGRNRKMAGAAATQSAVNSGTLLPVSFHTRHLTIATTPDLVGLDYGAWRPRCNERDGVESHE